MSIFQTLSRNFSRSKLQYPSLYLLLNRYSSTNPVTSYDFEYYRFFASPGNDRSNIKVLDIPCGTGNYIYRMHNLGFKHLIGIDISETSIYHANTH